MGTWTYDPLYLANEMAEVWNNIEVVWYISRGGSLSLKKYLGGPIPSSSPVRHHDYSDRLAAVNQIKYLNDLLSWAEMTSSVAGPRYFQTPQNAHPEPSNALSALLIKWGLYRVLRFWFVGHEPVVRFLSQTWPWCFVQRSLAYLCFKSAISMHRKFDIGLRGKLYTNSCCFHYWDGDLTNMWDLRANSGHVFRTVRIWTRN